MSVPVPNQTVAITRNDLPTPDFRRWQLAITDAVNTPVDSTPVEPVTDDFLPLSTYVKGVDGLAFYGALSTGGVSLGLETLADSGAGALLGITRDSFGRVSGTTDATITGTASEIDVADGDAVAGPPTLSLADVADAGGGTLQKTAFDAKGRKTGTSAATTTDLAEGTNLYYTAARVRAALLVGLSTASSAVITAADSVLSAFGKLQAQITALSASLSGYVPTSRTISTTAPLTGGGDLSANRTLAISAATTVAAGSMSAADKSKLDGVAAGATAYTDADARAAVVASTITNGDTTHAPSGDAVFDALALKADDSGVVHKSGSEQIIGDKIFSGEAVFARSGAPTQNLTVIKDGLGNGFLSLSPTTNAKTITFNATTDALNTAPTGGAVGMVWRLLGVTVAEISSLGNFQPGADNTYSNGVGARRWSVVYAATGTINTSDAREKTAVAPLTEAEIAAAKQLVGEIGTFQWLASIEAKGVEKARHHVGLTVQRCIEVMRSHGLDPFRYAFICYDEWDETPEVKGEETGEVTQEYRPAGNRYSLRPSELAHFVMRGLAHRQDELERRLAALES